MDEQLNAERKGKDTLVRCLVILEQLIMVKVENNYQLTGFYIIAHFGKHSVIFLSGCIEA